jgi:hypothetical protein
MQAFVIRDHYGTYVVRMSPCNQSVAAVSHRLVKAVSMLSMIVERSALDECSLRRRECPVISVQVSIPNSTGPFCAHNGNTNIHSCGDLCHYESLLALVVMMESRHSAGNTTTSTKAAKTAVSEQGKRRLR